VDYGVKYPNIKVFTNCLKQLQHCTLCKTDTNVHCILLPFLNSSRRLLMLSKVKKFSTQHFLQTL